MKGLISFVVILYSIMGFSQKKYNVDIIEEKHKYYKDDNLFKKFIQNFSKIEFDEIFKTTIINNEKIDAEKLMYYHNSILKNIPNDSISHIWVVYGYKNGQFYSKYALKKYLNNKKNIFFIQLNYHIDKKNDKIDSISIYIPKKSCNKIKRYNQKYTPSELFQTQKINNNNIVIDTDYNIEKQKEKNNNEVQINKAVWFN